MILIIVWAVMLAWWARCSPVNPKMDAISWVSAGKMLREGQPAGRIYDLATTRVVILIDHAPGRIFGGPGELTLTRVFPGSDIATQAMRLGFPDKSPPAFVYAPGAALLGVPLSFFGWPGATVVLDFAGLLILGAAIAALLFRIRGETSAALIWLAGLLALFGISHPLLFSLMLGQVTPVIAGGWILLWRPRPRSGEVLQGLLLGLLSAAKVFPLLLLLWLLFQRRWTTIAITTIVFAVACFALGTDALTAWLAAARQMSAPIRLWTENQSLADLFHRFFYPIGLVRDWVIVQPAAPAMICAIPGLLMLLIWALRARALSHEKADPVSEARLFAALWFLPAGAMALYWSHYAVLLYPAIALVIAAPNIGRTRRVGSAIAAILLCINPDWWTHFMPQLTQLMGEETAAFLMRIMVGLPALSIALLFALVLPRRQKGEKSISPTPLEMCKDI